MKKILHPPVRSYVLRQGRMTKAQRDAIDSLWVKYGLQVNDTPIVLENVFARDAPCIFEIGFGNGESLLKQANSSPESNFIGVEVHGPGVGHLIAKAEQRGLTNLRIFQHDAVDVIRQAIPDVSLDKVQIFFPDPWPKKRHHKRRLIQDHFLDLLLPKIKIGGLIHCATDWENYAQHMFEILSTRDDIANIEIEGAYFQKPYDLRPKTKFEQRGLKLDYIIRDLVYKRIK